MTEPVFRIVQLTDCHLFADPSATLRGVVTWDRFQAAVSAISTAVPDFDLLVLSGDTADDEQPQTYDAVRRALQPWADRVRVIPGNHDDKAAVAEVWLGDAAPLPGYVTFRERLGSWQVIGLDTQLPGQLFGAVSDQQILWLNEQLRKAGDLPTLLFMHHPPIDVHSPWLDRIGLQDRDEFCRFIGRQESVRLIACGHVHQPVAASLHAATVVTTPAVGPQFRPRTEEPVIEAGQPGWRLIEVYGSGDWSTQVHYV